MDVLNGKRLRTPGGQRSFFGRSFEAIIVYVG
jgi:hypothetical protein